ncbi:non-homologous end-joining DNA ligase [Autumnicola edwardsiae]|uniref:Non-homologous end-joining DNA ligase n=1 Tax=Autumnicola edwardsiae TaxID=3075594 RepID=A0ABU3CXA2_9FLAO|nr:non-homologous end-joining DNA ligase [Zunongwangia sp. F297]MDT0650964.1 non-homologous end-joining DNA ligase [Zunongwangia sp. F297]
MLKKMAEEIYKGAHEFELSNRDKIYYPKSEYTKGEIIDYYEKNSEVMLPHLKDRPVTMLRFPNGIEDKKFFQKDAPDYFPEWIETVEIPKQEGGTTNYVICNNASTLVYLANQACITPHIWLSKKDKPDYPDRMIFDLDPSRDDFSEVKTAAKRIRELLEEQLKLPVFLMTTGSRGLHMVVPLKPEENFDEVRDFAWEIAKYLEDKFPKDYTTATRKNKRENKLFLDVARNGLGQTTVAPYAVRPLQGAPIATPIDWDELNSLDSAQKYNLKNIFKRLARKEDPWSKIAKKATTLKSAKETFSTMLKEKNKKAND